MNDLYVLVERLDEEIAQLPAGYISKKIIRGKVQYYLQWKENGKLKSKYVRGDDGRAAHAVCEQSARV